MTLPALSQQPAAQPRLGQGELATAWVGGASAVVRLAARNPLKFVLSRDRGPCARAQVATFGGGLLAGDHVSIDLEVGANSALALGSAAPAKVYRAQGELESRQELRARVGEGATLALVPAPIACFRGARYVQRQEIALEKTASLLAVEVFTSGRPARGERWAFERLSSQLRVSVDERLVLHDGLQLERSAVPLWEKLGRYEAFGTLVLWGSRFQGAASQILRRIGSAPAEPKGGVRASVSPLADGILLRAAAEAIEPLAGILQEHVDPLLAELSPDDVWRRPW